MLNIAEKINHAMAMLNGMTVMGTQTANHAVAKQDLQSALDMLGEVEKQLEENKKLIDDQNACIEKLLDELKALNGEEVKLHDDQA